MCECGGNIFQDGYQIREISKFITGTPQNAVIPLQVFYCIKCYKVPAKFQPNISKKD
jgi:hypothetical protein